MYVCMYVPLQKKRDEYQRVQRERENAELDKMKMIQREKVFKEKH